MNSGTFHISSQEWRYFSREKAIIHTTHLAQLPSGTPGDTILIDSTAPASSNNNNFSVPPVSIPSFPGINVVENLKFSRNTLPDVFGSVGMNKTVLAQKNCIIQFSTWAPSLMQFYITPNAAGWYLLHVQAQSDARNASYLGPTSSQSISCSIDRMPVGLQSTQIAGNSQAIQMIGIFGTGPNQWSTSTYSIDNQLMCHGQAIFIIPKNNTVVFTGQLLGNAPDAQLTGYLFKIADIP